MIVPALLTVRRFLPLFAAQFLGAANDNLFKNALVVLVVFRLAPSGGLSPSILVTLAGGVFILPFFLFSATAGQMADRFRKTTLVRLVKLAEIVIAVAGAGALIGGNVVALLGVLFLFGLHSTVFGPLKYALLPEMLAADELVAGNALVEAGTFVAILLGTIAGGVLVTRPGGEWMVAVLMVIAALGGASAAWVMPQSAPGRPQVRIRANLLADTADVLALLRGCPQAWRAVLGISWFWLVGATYLAQFPAFAKQVLFADEQAVTLMLTVFSVGIAVGSFLCGRMLGGRLSLRTLPWGIAGLSLFGGDLWLTSSEWASAGGTELSSLAIFLVEPGAWRVMADLAGVAVSGGFYIVPLYTLMQTASAEAERGRIVAANNILNAAFMVVSALAAAAALAAGATIPQLFLAVSCLNLLALVLRPHRV